jgi:hypothetical protein
MSTKLAVSDDKMEFVNEVAASREISPAEALDVILQHGRSRMNAVARYAGKGGKVAKKGKAKPAKAASKPAKASAKPAPKPAKTAPKPAKKEPTVLKATTTKPQAKFVGKAKIAGKANGAAAVLEAAAAE